MKKTGHNAIVLMITFLLFGCATGTDTATPGSAQAPPQAIADNATGEDDVKTEVLRQSLREAIADPSHRDSLHMSVRCVGEDGMRAAEVYGNGVGIWDFRRQFRLEPAEVSSLIEILDRADFVSFADIYGGPENADPKPRKEKFGACCPMQIVCSVEVTLAGGTKQAAQRGKGEQSAQLRQLADDLLDACEEPGRAGTTAADLAEGMEKVASGILAPETFSVLLHRKPELGAETGDPGFLLHVSGGLATNRGYDTEGRLLDPVSLRLRPTEVQSLARELAGSDLTGLPLNLFAPDYRDLSVEVLDQKMSVQARRFAGMTSATQAESQAEFERVYDTLYALHLRVLSEGD